MSHPYSSYSEYLRHPKFRAVVAECMKRAGGQCERVHTPEGYKYEDRCPRPAVDPHHKQYPPWGEFDVPGNIEMLCRECHEAAHRCIECGEFIPGKELEEMMEADHRPMHFRCFAETKK